MTTVLNFAPTAHYQQAGLVAYKSDAVSARLVRIYTNYQQLVGFYVTTRGWDDFAWYHFPYTGKTT